MTEIEWDLLRARLKLLMGICLARGKELERGATVTLFDLTKADDEFLEKDLVEFFDPLKKDATEPLRETPQPPQTSH